MATIYIDPLNGTDDGAAGRGETDGTSAYASISYALANYGSFATTSGNTIFLADTSADVLTSPLDFDTSVAKAEAPLAIVGYHYDGGNGGTAGALTMTLPWGDTGVTCGEIDGNDAVATICDLNTTNTLFYNLKIHSTTGAVLPLSTASKVICCEVYNGGTETIGGLNNTVINSYLHTDQTAVYAIVSDAAFLYGCEIEGGFRGVGVNARGAILGNLIHGQTDEGVTIYLDDVNIINNTIDGTGADSDAHGIQTLNNLASYEQYTIINNLITNWSGATAKGIGLPTGAPPMLIENNAFYNNTTDLDAPDSGYDGTNITESGDPFTDSPNDDYSLVSGASSNDAAIATPHTANIGAWQEKPTGGGGGGETTSVFMA